jgi:hypothetical protein
MISMRIQISINVCKMSHVFWVVSPTGCSKRLKRNVANVQVLKPYAFCHILVAITIVFWFVYCQVEDQSEAIERWYFVIGAHSNGESVIFRRRSVLLRRARLCFDSKFFTLSYRNTQKSKIMYGWWNSEIKCRVWSKARNDVRSRGLRAIVAAPFDM